MWLPIKPLTEVWKCHPVVNLLLWSCASYAFGAFIWQMVSGAGTSAGMGKWMQWNWFEFIFYFFFLFAWMDWLVNWLKLCLALQCYTCTYVAFNDDDYSCVENPSHQTNCSKRFCTIVRQESKVGDGFKKCWSSIEPMLLS